VYTGYYIQDGFIYGPKHSGQFYILQGHVYGPRHSGLIISPTNFSMDRALRASSTLRTITSMVPR
jgi:hypothetical protein